MGDINRLGTQIRLPDGREATVIFNGLSGVGVKWGLHNPDPRDFDGTTGDWCRPPYDSPVARAAWEGRVWPWKADAMLRDAKLEKHLGMPCVGEEYEILRVGAGIT